MRFEEKEKSKAIALGMSAAWEALLPGIIRSYALKQSMSPLRQAHVLIKVLPSPERQSALFVIHQVVRRLSSNILQ